MNEQDFLDILRNPDITVQGGYTPPIVPAIGNRKPEEYDADEAHAQTRVVRWAKENEFRHPALAYLFHPANGEYRPKGTAGKLKAMGVKSGVPDLWLPWRDTHGRVGLVIELKHGRNQPTPMQEAYMEYLHEIGWVVIVAYSSQEAIEAIAKYLEIE
jgi:hypothetical protein